MARLDRTELKALYGADYAQRLDARSHAVRLKRLVENMDLRPSHDVVDFGCGSGALLELVGPRVRTYTGVDFSASFIAIAQRRKATLGAQNAVFSCSSIEDFCRAHPNKFDAAFAFDFSEHVYDDDWVAILEHMRGSLRPHGRLYLHTPNAEFILELMKAHGILLKQSPEHVAVRTVDHNVKLLERAGYRVLSAKLLPHYNVLRFIHPLSYVPFVGRFLKARLFIEAAGRQRDGEK